MKVVLDLAWGASVNLGPDLFKALGAEVIAVIDSNGIALDFARDVRFDTA